MHFVTYICVQCRIWVLALHIHIFMQAIHVIVTEKQEKTLYGFEEGTYSVRRLSRLPIQILWARMETPVLGVGGGTGMTSSSFGCLPNGSSSGEWSWDREPSGKDSPTDSASDRGSALASFFTWSFCFSLIILHKPTQFKYDKNWAVNTEVIWWAGAHRSQIFNIKKSSLVCPLYWYPQLESNIWLGLSWNHLVTQRWLSWYLIFYYKVSSTVWLKPETVVCLFSKICRWSSTVLQTVWDQNLQLHVSVQRPLGLVVEFGHLYASRITVESVPTSYTMVILLLHKFQPNFVYTINKRILPAYRTSMIEIRNAKGCDAALHQRFLSQFRHTRRVALELLWCALIRNHNCPRAVQFRGPGRWAGPCRQSKIDHIRRAEPKTIENRWVVKVDKCFRKLLATDS